MSDLTNNEHETLADVIANAGTDWESRLSQGEPTRPMADEVADAILAAGFRRLPVSGDNAVEEIADALWFFRTREMGISSADRRTPDYAEAVEAAQDVVELLSASQPRAMSGDNAQLSAREQYLAQPVNFGTDSHSQRLAEADAFDAGWNAAPVASQPREVEVTETCRAVCPHDGNCTLPHGHEGSHEARDGSGQIVYCTWSAALGGGDQR